MASYKVEEAVARATMEDLGLVAMGTEDGTGKRPSEWFMEQLRDTRKRKGWNQERLADRLAEMGSGLDKSAIAKIETGRRGISLDESVAIAAALGVSPLQLWTPRAAGASVAVTPTMEVGGQKAREWDRGEDPLDADTRFYRQELSEEDWDAMMAAIHEPQRDDS